MKVTLTSNTESLIVVSYKPYNTIISKLKGFVLTNDDGIREPVTRIEMRGTTKGYWFDAETNGLTMGNNCNEASKWLYDDDKQVIASFCEGDEHYIFLANKAEYEEKKAEYVKFYENV